MDILCSPADPHKSRLRAYLILQRSARRGKFRHEVKKYGDWKKISERGVYRFSFELAPAEKGYLYVGGQNMIIENIAAAFDPK